MEIHQLKTFVTVAQEAEARGGVEILCAARPTIGVLFAFRADRSAEPLLTAVQAVLNESP